MTVEYIGDGNTDGTCLGQSSSELIAFHGATPIAQPAAAAQAAAPLSLRPPRLRRVR